jgi:hypothetical protein
MSTQLKFQLYEQELLNPLRGHALTDEESFVASLLLTANTHRPIGITEIIQAIEQTEHLRLKGKTVKSKERAVKFIIRTLRKDHSFPILARRSKPTGYWWCGSTDEMKAFIESFRAQALDELHTLSKIVKYNYPALQGQLNFED